jgi:hypothetical protein
MLYFGPGGNNMSDPIKEWQQGKNENLQEAFTEGRSEWLGADSLLRPSNMKLWYHMKQQEPEFSLQKPAGCDKMFQDYEKRLEWNNKTHESGEGARLQPWFMMGDKPR